MLMITTGLVWLLCNYLKMTHNVAFFCYFEKNKTKMHISVFEILYFAQQIVQISIHS